MDARKRIVRVKDVAAAAGVSVTTVSDALNGKGRLPAATREHVRSVAARLGYRPSVIARRLASGKSGTLALTVSPADAAGFAFGAVDYFVALMSSATSKALEYGYSLILLHGEATGLRAEPPIDGAIVVDPVRDDATLVNLRRAGVPTVTTGRDPSGRNNEFWVDNDHIAGTRKMLDHLRAGGAERIALISGPPVNSYTVDAVEAYEDWCDRRGCPPSVSIARHSLTEAAGYAAASELFRGAARPDAIFATLDRLAIGAVLSATAHGLVVPDDVLVAGLSDSDASSHANPPLTTLSLNPQDIGARAVDLLVALIEEREVPEPHVRVPTRVVARSSTRRRAARAVAR